MEKTLNMVSKGFPNKTCEKYLDTQLDKETFISKEFFNTLTDKEKEKFKKI